MEILFLSFALSYRAYLMGHLDMAEDWFVLKNGDCHQPFQEAGILPEQAPAKN
ncbi:hypothetical protein GOZ78_14135 [Agrobacterium vitis]|uniref:Uncharacterized protein n=1 Tax=Agrobacterium vitis TaxID=373 RepID=A0AAE4WEG3_AGRVI|nr:hypothetical protein [Agrobacterium vitis]MCM2440516.1 hypothetical protein [Agrobacterium vitis]MUO81835.1 hypothetical protein [Agrobacterium vitis]MUO93511.1 hypothetical protein [Agrobacterium vitis]MUP04239.1 hypothetical protein [Agrobacterium vitis]MUZ59502.1 hypothetical protein [Agrobacterium vitis]